MRAGKKLSFNELNSQIATINSVLGNLKKKGVYGIDNFSVFPFSNKKNSKIKIQIDFIDRSKINFDFDLFSEIDFDFAKKQIKQMLMELMERRKNGKKG